MNYPHGDAGWHQMPPPNMPPQGYPGQPYPSQPYGPGYYGPFPPPKKKKAWPWVLLAIVAVIVVAVGGVFGFKYYDLHRTVTYTYEVTGTGTTALISHSYNGGASSGDTEVPLPWTKTFEGERDASFHLLANAFWGETVTCKVSIDGTVIITKTESSGKWAACSGPEL
ncbi:hypothetical protein [Mycolicibacterium houstonense]|uniref:hypothetical protein n=1 Tax=Mycolicibacterium houstonense TaxID=146021 RepID=UPI0008354231|nr:hypothetical protein [Mycolicibacterium houstonense]